MATNYPQQTITTFLGLSLIGMDEVIAEDMIIIDNAFGSGGLGVTLQTNSVNNTLQNLLNLEAGANITLTADAFGGVTIASSGGVAPVSSVFGRTGAVVAVSGDYSVGQVTGAAPLASPTFTGVPAAPTAAPGTNTTQLATTGFVTAAVTAGQLVTSVFTRTGAVVAVAGDYSLDKIGSPLGNVAFTMTGDTLQFNWGSTNTNVLQFDSSGNPTFGLVSFTTAVTNSPIISLAGSYQSAASTFAQDTWTIKNIIGAGTNGTSTLAFAHTGTTGALAVSFGVTSINTPDFSLVTGSPGGANGSGYFTLASNWNAFIRGNCAGGYAGVVLANTSLQTAPSATTYGAYFGVLMGGNTGYLLGSAPTSGSMKYISVGEFSQINQTGSATGNYTGHQVTVQETAFLGTTGLLLDLQLACAITNIVETSGNQVTLTVVNNTAVAGQSVFLDRLTTGTWLLGLTVTLLSGTNSTTLVFTDPTGHGTQVSHAETGIACLSQFSVSRTGASAISGTLALGNIINTYRGVSTVSSGVPAEFATVDLIAQSAAITATTLLATSTIPGSGMYRISWVAAITTAASGSSSLGGTNGFQVVFTSPTDNAVKTSVTGPVSTANTTATTIGGDVIVYAKSSTNIQYQFDYASIGVTAMVYELHIKCEAL